MNNQNDDHKLPDDHRQVLSAMTMVAFRGYDSEETAQRLLCALAGSYILDDLDARVLKRAPRKLEHATDTVRKLVNGYQSW